MADEDFRSRYPGFDVLAKWDTPDWDDQTREVVRRRLEVVPPLRFFDEREARTLAAAAERIVPQPDRDAAARVPIVPWIDQTLHLDEREGFRYEDMPPPRESWRLGLAGLDEAAGALFDRPFADLEPEAQDRVLREVEGGHPPGDAWRRVPAARFFTHLLLRLVVANYYAHPLAWNEIGYSGPSSPRGHVRKRRGRIDPWEARERR